ncbi:MAG: hypothetical protein HYY06_15630 [Deltaproteobacteria bacterium]|nr:hypothetical protein [Deltaproteobacteria bacterium]
MRRVLPEALGTVLVLGSLGLFYQCVVYLQRRDYVAAILIMFVGFAVVRSGVELLRSSLAE